MIACTKLFAIDEVRLVIFKGALNFISLPLLFEKRPVSVGPFVISVRSTGYAIC
jgi:hypothetical protein